MFWYCKKGLKRCHSFGKNIGFFINPTGEVQQCNIYFILTIYFEDLTSSLGLKNKIVKKQ